jgi:acetate kinase
MGEIGSVEKSAEKIDLILVLNSGSSSLKFGVYYRGANDEEPLLTGSAEGIGHSNGSLHIRAADGRSLVQLEKIHESQGDALAALAASLEAHIASTPVAVGHRVVHGGPELRRHQIITPQFLDQLRSAIHFAPLHIPQALSLITTAQSIFPSAAQFACFDDAFHHTIPEVASHLPVSRSFLRVPGAYSWREASRTSHLCASRQRIQSLCAAKWNID